MSLALAAIAVFLLAGLAALLLRRSPAASTALGAGGAALASILGIAGSLAALRTGAVESVRWTWEVPWGSLSFRLDALSAWFLLPAFAIAGIAAVFGSRYLWDDRRHRPLGTPWFFYDLLCAGIALVFLADNGMLFIAAWEVMSVAAYFLVVYEDGEESSRNAGWIFLIAAHLGVVFLLVLFPLLAGPGAADLDFERFRVAAGGPAAPGGIAFAGTAFILALLGFGAKAGFVPLHVWLPEAHPAAPSHVSALMSAVMIKTGIYGLMRALTWLGPPQAWWGWILVAVGLASGILGAVFALAQGDLKRLLAYSSVENIGIIALGLGAGCLGLERGDPALAVLGFAGALLHVLHHAFFKGLLFLGAGAVYHATGTRDLGRLGGLARRMPWIAAAFLVGTVAVAGLPPLNGFASEFLIYRSAFQGAAGTGAAGALPFLATIAGLALIGGLAAAAFAKAFGIAFLGEARSHAVGTVHEAEPLMLTPLVALASACAALGLAAPLVVRGLAPAVAILVRLPEATVRSELAGASETLARVTLASAAFLVALALLVLLRRFLLSGRAVAAGPTWGCGYGETNPRMQYTASSFTQPLAVLFHVALRQQRTTAPPQGFSPAEASMRTETPDVFGEVLYRSSYDRIARGLSRFRRIQQGRVQTYVLYVALTLLALLLWKLGGVSPW